MCRIYQPLLRFQVMVNSKIPNALCDHAFLVMNPQGMQPAHIPCLPDAKLDEMVSAGILSAEKKETCLELSRLAQSVHAPLLAVWPFRTTRSVVSVFTGTRSYWCPTGRVRVSFDPQGPSWFCVCPVSGCVHRKVLRWYLFVERPHMLRGDKEDVEVQEPVDAVEPPEEQMREQDMIRKMALHRYRNCRLPVEFPPELLNEGCLQPPFSFAPTETCCAECNAELGDARPVTTKATLLVLGYPGLHKRRCLL